MPKLMVYTCWCMDAGLWVPYMECYNCYHSMDYRGRLVRKEFCSKNLYATPILDDWYMFIFFIQDFHVMSNTLAPYITDWVLIVLQASWFSYVGLLLFSKDNVLVYLAVLVRRTIWNESNTQILMRWSRKIACANRKFAEFKQVIFFGT